DGIRDATVTGVQTCALPIYRVGPRHLITGGLLAVAVSLLWQSQITTHSSYGMLIFGFVLMGLGMGFVMSPMSTAAMNAVEQTKRSEERRVGNGEERTGAR